MPRQTALRVRMNLAKSVDASDMSDFAAAIGNLEKLRNAATELGFTFTSDLSSVVGSYDFGDDGSDKK